MRIGDRDGTNPDVGMRSAPAAVPVSGRRTVHQKPPRHAEWRAIRSVWGVAWGRTGGASVASVLTRALRSRFAARDRLPAIATFGHARSLLPTRHRLTVSPPGAGDRHGSGRGWARDGPGAEHCGRFQVPPGGARAQCRVPVLVACHRHRVHNASASLSSTGPAARRPCDIG